MVVRVYVSGISGNKEVKKRQQRVTMILDSKNIKYDLIDITEPGKESEKEFMQENSKARDSKYPLPPQIFNDDNYCGDYEGFDMANELDELEKFLNITGNNQNNSSENGFNGAKEIEKDDSFSVKEDLRDCTEENIEIVDEGNTEAVSLDNEVQNVPESDEIEHDLEEHESIKNDDENPKIETEQPTEFVTEE